MITNQIEFKDIEVSNKILGKGLTATVY